MHSSMRYVMKVAFIVRKRCRTRWSWSLLFLCTTLLLSCSRGPRYSRPFLDMSLAIPTIAEDYHMGWLQQTVSDIKSQSLKPREVIVVMSNTSSAEATSITRYLKEALSPIKTIVTSSASLSPPGRSRNRAIQLARGEIISFFDGDDGMHPHRLELIARAFEEDANVQLVLHGLKSPDQSFEPSLTYADSHKLFRDELCEVHERTFSLHPWLTSEKFQFEVAHGHLSFRKKLTHYFMFTEDVSGEDCGFVRSVLQAVCSRESRVSGMYLDVPLSFYLPRSRKKNPTGKRRMKS